VDLVCFPWLAIDHDELFSAILNHPPCSDDWLERSWRLPDALVAQVHSEFGGGKSPRPKRHRGATGRDDHEVTARQLLHDTLLICRRSPRPSTASGQTM